jgi:hypothetical protein
MQHANDFIYTQLTVESGWRKPGEGENISEIADGSERGLVICNNNSGKPDPETKNTFRRKESGKQWFWQSGRSSFHVSVSKSTE